MTIKEQVEAAASPKDAMLVIASALDTLIENSSATQSDWDSGWDETPAATITVDEDGNATVDLREVGPELREARREFARDVLRLHEAYKDGEQFIDAYGKGGPYWLYLSDRDFVLGLPEDTKRRMLDDLNRQDPKTATEVARDILKNPEPGELPSLSSVSVE